MKLFYIFIIKSLAQSKIFTLNFLCIVVVFKTLKEKLKVKKMSLLQFCTRMLKIFHFYTQIELFRWTHLN